MHCVVPTFCACDLDVGDNVVSSVAFVAVVACCSVEAVLADVLAGWRAVVCVVVTVGPAELEKVADCGKSGLSRAGRWGSASVNNWSLARLT